MNPLLRAVTGMGLMIAAQASAAGRAPTEGAPALKNVPVVSGATTGSTVPAQPNVILIMADDLGPAMLGCYGQKIVKTPNIDRLAAEGMKFNNYYGSTFCAPARWTLLTGLHCGRMGGWENNKGGLAIRHDQGELSDEEYEKLWEKKKAEAYPIAPDEVFLGQVGQRAGYATCQVGKLDRGFQTWHERVKRFGWDFYEGYYCHQRCHGYYPPYLWRNGERFDLPGNSSPDCGKGSDDGMDPVGSHGQTYSQNVFIKTILTYIRAHQNQPFFLYHPTQLPHGPVAIPELHPEVANDPNLTLPEKKFASMVKMLDDHVGLILDELETLGMDENTLVIFSSDNGHCLYYDKTPYANFRKQIKPDGTKANLTDDKWRTSTCGDVFDGSGGRAGQKRSGYQGGIQCPLIARWPGQIAPGTETDLLSTHYDFMATLADVIGGKLPEGKDSISYLPTLLGREQEKTHDYIIFQNRFPYMGGSSVITREGWKLLEIGREHDQFQLYNILKDNEERDELSAQYPEKVETLKAILKSEVRSARPDL